MIWPQNLTGQTIALLLIALLGSHMISFLIFSDEQRLALLDERRKNALARIVPVVRLLEDTPPALHERILKATNSGWIKFQLAEQSAVDTNVFEYADNPLQRHLVELLENKAQARVQLYANKHEKPEQSKRVYRNTPRSLNFVVAITLSSGQWLNVKSYHYSQPKSLISSSLISSLFMAVAVTAIVIFILRRITHPLVELTMAVEKLGRGEITPQLPESGPADIRQTTRAFNQMNQRLQRFVQDRTRLLAAISHDLRTPITILRLRAEFIEDTESRRKILATLDEMQAMTEAALAFARDAATEEETRRVDLSALVASLCDDLADMGQEVQFTEEQKHPYACRPHSLKRALRNMIENAVRYGKRARVSIEASETELHINIDDDGPGIQADDLERVFEPFVRLETSRNRETGGIGLGMSIARSIVHGHGGEIVLKNRKGGLRVIVTLPYIINHRAA
ncbi:MAG: ATP-binding protein [Pseudomonadota bacterium]